MACQYMYVITESMHNITAVIEEAVCMRPMGLNC